MSQQVFLMSCGTSEYRYPDEWIEVAAEGRVGHIAKWWSSTCPRQIRRGDVAVLVATKSGKVLGAYAIVREPVEDHSHPRDPEKWPWRVDLRPLVLLDGSVAPRLVDFGLKAPHKYVSVDPAVANDLLRAIHPSL
jgi:hypothetical protein